MTGTLVNERCSDALARLLGLGDKYGENWPDYADHGIGPEHIGGLIRMACDPQTHQADRGSGPVWAPIHAWRALGQLRAVEAVEPLLALLQTLDDDDFADNELPIVFGMIGPPAVPTLTGYLDKESSPTIPSATVMSGLEQIALRHPGCRDACVEALTRLLRRPAVDRLLLGFAVSSLLKLSAAESIEPLRDAFRRNAVDISVAGDLEDIEIALGFRTDRDTPRPHYMKEEGWLLPQPAPATTLLRAEKIGRNEPCPCGSGRKFKKCCMQ